MKYHIGERTVMIDESAEARYKAALEVILRLAQDDYLDCDEIWLIASAALSSVAEKTKDTTQQDLSSADATQADPLTAQCWCGEYLTASISDEGTGCYVCPVHGCRWMPEDDPKMSTNDHKKGT